MVAKQPSANGGNGARNTKGQFAKGNPGGPGNPHAKQVAKLRSLIFEAITEEDLRAVIAALVEQAKAGDVVATRELLNRLTGKPATAPDPENLELEQRRIKVAEDRVELEEERLWDNI